MVHVVICNMTVLFGCLVQHNLIPQPPRSKYIDDDDDLVLEDEKERVVLTGNITAGESVTGASYLDLMNVDFYVS